MLELNSDFGLIGWIVSALFIVIGTMATTAYKMVQAFVNHIEKIEDRHASEREVDREVHLQAEHKRTELLAIELRSLSEKITN